MTRETPIVVNSVRDAIVSVLQREILSGIHPPGRRMLERELARRFQVSTIPVREALIELENRGLVRSRFNHGCAVIQLSAEEVTHASRFRRALEPAVVAWAGKRLSEEDKRTLHEQLARLESAAEKGDLPEFFYQDIVFHRAVWRPSGNPYAIRALEAAMSPLFACGLMLVKDTASFDLRQEARKHRVLTDALCAGKTAEAVNMLRRIAGNFERQVLAILRGRSHRSSANT